MTWYAFQGLNNGKAIDLAGLQEKQATIEGFHGYPTEVMAEQHPNAVNPLTRILADTWIADYNAALSTQSQPGGKNASNLGVVGAVQNAVGTITSPLDFITSQAFWIRAGEIIAGIILLSVGLVRLSGSSPLASKIVQAVPGAAVAKGLVK